MGIGTDAVVDQAHHAQALIPPFAYLLGGDDRVGALHGEDKTQGRRSGVFVPGRQVLI